MVVAALVLDWSVFVKAEEDAPVVNSNETVVPNNIEVEINKSTVIANGKDYAYISVTLYDNQQNPVADIPIVITSDREAKDFLYRSVSGSIRLNTDPHGRAHFSVTSETEGISQISIQGKNTNMVNQKITFIKPESNISLKIHPNGTLMRFSVYPRIWQTIEGRKHIIPTADVFNAYKFDWNKIVTEYNPNVIDAYPNIDLIREKGGIKIYQLIGCLGRYGYRIPQKHWIPSPELFAKYEFSWDEVIEVSKEEIDLYPRVSLITVSDSNNIYYLTEEGQRRLIPNPEIFTSYGYEWNDILFISDDEFIKYPKGEPIE